MTGTPAGERPEWLPEGWTTKVQPRKNRKDFVRTYVSPLSGYTCHSKAQVMRLNEIEKNSGQMRGLTNSEYNEEQELDGQATTPKSSSRATRNHNQSTIQFGDSPAWLPSGWIMEIRTAQLGAGRSYKCYYDPYTKSRFYSKKAVYQYLQTVAGNSSNGWVMESKLRKTLRKRRVRKDLSTDGKDTQPIQVNTRASSCRQSGDVVDSPEEATDNLNMPPFTKDTQVITRASRRRKSGDVVDSPDSNTAFPIKDDQPNQIVTRASRRRKTGDVVDSPVEDIIKLTKPVYTNVVKHTPQALPFTPAYGSDDPFSMTNCMSELKKMQGISNTVLVKGVTALTVEVWREAFMNMDGNLKKAWLESLV